MLSNLGKKALTDLAISLGGDNLPGLVSNSASNVINKFERKISGKWALTKSFVYLFWMTVWMILLKP